MKPLMPTNKIEMSLKLTISLVTSLWIIACSGRIGNVDPTDSLVIYPPPPDTTRIQYLTSFSNSIDISGQKSSFMRYVLGEDQKKPIHKPYGLCLSDGKLYICDSMLPGIEIIDFAKQDFRYFAPGGRGQLKKPINCAINEHGHLFVADAARRQIIIFNKDGTYIAEIGDGKQGKPTDVLFYENKLLVCDLDAHQVKVYNSSTYDLISAFPDTNQNNVQYLFSPTNISAYNGKIYVTDTGDARIKIFDENGIYLGFTGSFGKRPGQFVRPKGVAVDMQGRIYVADAAFENVQIFNQASELLMYFGGTYRKPGDMWLPAGIIIDYTSLSYFEDYVYKGFDLQYLIFVANQYGPDKVSVYGFVEPTE